MTEENGMQYQVRRYQIDPAHLDVFVEEWRAGVAPAREQHGFTVHGAWVADATSEFFWILSHDDPAGFEAADAAYYGSAARTSLSPDPARHIRSTTELDVRRVR